MTNETAEAPSTDGAGLLHGEVFLPPPELVATANVPSFEVLHPASSLRHRRRWPSTAIRPA